MIGWPPTGAVHSDIDRLAPEEGLPALAAAEEERTMKWEAVLLLGTWADAMDAVDAVSRARRAFYQSAKRDIGIAAGDASESDEWQLAN